MGHLWLNDNSHAGWSGQSGRGYVLRNAAKKHESPKKIPEATKNEKQVLKKYKFGSNLFLTVS